jgi:AcrR family transcriptional regulator
MDAHPVSLGGPRGAERPSPDSRAVLAPAPTGNGPGGGPGLAPAARKLRPRRGGHVPREEIERHQRERLHEAMTALIGERGYQALTVRELCARAGVSTRTLYELFDGPTDRKEACFVSTYEALVRDVIEYISAAQPARGDWRAVVRCSFEALALAIARWPERARLLLVEPYGAGPLALERMMYTSELFERRLLRRLEDASDGLVLAPIAAKGIVTGLARVARRRLLEGRSAEAPAYAAELFEWALSYRAADGEALVELLRGENRAVSPSGSEEGAGRDDRARLLHAAAQIAARHGYGALSVARIAEEAGLSRHAFDLYFEDIAHCFLAAVELRVRRAHAFAARAGQSGPQGPAAVYRAMHALTARIAGAPVLSRLSFIEVFALGPDSVAPRERLMGALGELFWGLLPPSQRPSEIVGEAAIGAVWGIAHDCVARGAARSLPPLAGPLAYTLLAPVVGARAAIREIRAEQARIAQARGRSRAPVAGQRTRARDGVK